MNPMHVHGGPLAVGDMYHHSAAWFAHSPAHALLAAALAATITAAGLAAQRARAARAGRRG